MSRLIPIFLACAALSACGEVAVPVTPPPPSLTPDPPHPAPITGQYSTAGEVAVMIFVDPENGCQYLLFSKGVARRMEPSGANERQMGCRRQ